MRFTCPVTTVDAAMLGGIVALLLRGAGGWLRRPVAVFIAGGAGLFTGWAMLGGVDLAPRGRAVFVALALLAAGLSVQDRVKTRGLRRESQGWLLALALFGGWCVAGPRALAWAAASAVLVVIGLLVDDAWGLAAAGTCLSGALIAIKQTALAAWGWVVVVAALGGGALLPQSAGLGLVTAGTLDAGIAHRVTFMAAGAAPIACLLLIRAWRRRFVRFGRAGSAIRAGAAAAIVCLLGFSAAAMSGMR